MTVAVGPAHAIQLEAAAANDVEEAALGMRPFAGLSKAAVEALRYRGEDIARSITKSVVKEVSSSFIHPLMHAVLQLLAY